jgi:hypothetical protein
METTRGRPASLALIVSHQMVSEPTALDEQSSCQQTQARGIVYGQVRTFHREN